MFGEFDRAFCANQTCPKSDRCGRSIKRLLGGHFIVSMSGFHPEPDGTCKYEEPYRTYTAPQWMQEKCARYEQERANEMARRRELVDSGGLDSDVGL